MKNTDKKKRDYVSEKEYVLYLSKGSEDPDGFIVEDFGMKKGEGSGEHDDPIEIVNTRELKLTEKIACATRFTSVEANRIAMEYHSKTERYPFKLKISNYKDLVF